MTIPSTSIPSLSVVVPTHDTRDLTLRCLESLVGRNRPPAEVIVVDDASSDGTDDAVRRRFPEARVIRLEENVGFSGAANRGATAATGDVLLFLNSDTEVIDDAVAGITRCFADLPAVGIAGAQLLDPDGTPQWSAGPSPTPTWLFLVASGLGALLGRVRPRRHPHSSVVAVDWVTGAALAVRRSVWEQVGPFDLRYRFYGQDLDLCRSAAAAGWEVALLPEVRVVHHHGKTISNRPGAVAGANPALLWTDLLRYMERHHGVEGARRAYRALATGGWLRVAARKLVRRLLGAGERSQWDAGTTAYARGLDALADWRRHRTAGDHPAV